MRLVRGFLVCFAVFTLSITSANGTILLDTTGTIDSTDPTLSQRLARDGFPSDWSFSKSFPGYLGGVGDRLYDLWSFSFGPSDPKFVQVIIDDPGALIFSSAHFGVFDPVDVETGYLGDLGTSGNPFGFPGFYQVIVPTAGDLHILVNRVDIGVSLPSYSYGIIVEAFYDSNFTDVPEPATVGLSAAGLIGLLAFKRKQSATARQ